MSPESLRYEIMRPTDLTAYFYAKGKNRNYNNWNVANNEKWATTWDDIFLTCVEILNEKGNE